MTFGEPREFAYINEDEMRIATIFLVILLGSCNSARSDILYYYPDATLRLGGTFDPLDLTKATPDCFQSDGEHSMDSSGVKAVSSEVNFTIKQVKDSRELQSLLKISSSMAGHFEIFSMDSSGDGTSKVDDYAESTSWVLMASSDFGRYRAINLRPNKAVIDLAKSDLNSVVARCGTDVVMQIKRGVSIAVIFTLNNSRLDHTEDYANDFNVGIGGDMFGFGGGGGSSGSLQSAITHGDLSLNVVGIGGDGASGLADLVTALKDQHTVDGVKAVLQTYVKTLTAESAAVTEYQTGSISQFLPNMALPEFTLYNRMIAEYYFALARNGAWRKILRDWLSGADGFESKVIANVRSAFDLTRKRSFDIASAARDCRDSYGGLLRRVVRSGDRSLIETIEARQNAELRQAKLGKSIEASSLLNSAAITLKRAGVTSKPCEFDDSWLDFSKFAALPQYPFDEVTIWSDPLGQSPSNFLYGRVKGKSVESVKFVNRQNNKDIVAFKSSGDTYEGLWDLTIDKSVGAIDMLVITTTGHRFAIRAWN
jgi:hypothetical protein